MKILSREEVDGLRIGFRNKFFFQNEVIIEQLDQLELGEGLSITDTDVSTEFFRSGAYPINRYFKGVKSDKEFIMRKINFEKEAVILRIK